MGFIFYYIHNATNKTLDIEFVCNCHYICGWLACILDFALHWDDLPCSKAMTLVSGVTL